ncbi:MAG: oxygen-independent coproporphyrinogen III oxidase [Bacteroidetes bacterium HGW-Bacteroidetes-17]|jgi:oxygen-independent coproporphyrinogen-3 oxidase|nr:MAG: oxygen-independent coproporphyrinogen III oxidase [Bacteroidetes bacterium HGW-Bacteroidetes-17]
MKVSKKLLEKYNVATPRYTSYPPANYFHEEFTNKKVEEAISLSNNEHPENISLYIHIPFCNKLCFYCGCNTVISRNGKMIDSYIGTLKKEIVLLKSKLDPNRKVSQVHWGGGTPNYLPIEDIESIMNTLYKNFNFISGAEIAMECHPWHLTYDYVDRLIELKFNRLSLGVQDFNVKVMDSINRNQSIIPIPELVEYVKANNVAVNLDFIYGLPFQTVETFTETIQKAIEISPNRLVTFSYAHVPWIKKAQQKLEKYNLPDADQKVKLFEAAYDLLTKSGYKAIGLDHFAKESDELYIALKGKTLHRNFQGYCTRETTGQVYALGVSGISQLESAYLQSTKNVVEYTQRINEGKFPIEKAYFLSLEEKITREIINELMCNLYLSWKSLSNRFNKPIEELNNLTKEQNQQLKTFESEGLITYNKDEIFITESGKFFIRNIAAAFDPKMQNTTRNFSKAL